MLLLGNIYDWNKIIFNTKFPSFIIRFIVFSYSFWKICQRKTKTKLIQKYCIWIAAATAAIVLVTSTFYWLRHNCLCYMFSFAVSTSNKAFPYLTVSTNYIATLIRSEKPISRESNIQQCSKKENIVLDLKKFFYEIKNYENVFSPISLLRIFVSVTT